MTALALFLGALGWSLSEYCIHRWLGHDRRFIRNLFGRQHTAHHGKGNHFAPVWMKFAAAVLLTVLLIGPATLVAGPTLGPTFVAGYISLYVYYELLHQLEHTWRGFGPYGRWARRHHFYHHFHNPAVNHGVSSPLWDIVFGTYEKPGVVVMPERLAPPWLVDPTTGDVYASLLGSYRLRKAHRRA